MIELYLGTLALLPLVIDLAVQRPFEPPKILLFEIATALFAAAVLVMTLYEKKRGEEIGVQIQIKN